MLMSKTGCLFDFSKPARVARRVYLTIFGGYDCCCCGCPCLVAVQETGANNFSLRIFCEVEKCIK